MPNPSMHVNDFQRENEGISLGSWYYETLKRRSSPENYGQRAPRAEAKLRRESADAVQDLTTISRIAIGACLDSKDYYAAG
jgi:hypothetical protein